MSDEDRRNGFGRLLADALRARGLRQDDLARTLGTTQSSVSGWINGKYEPAAATVFTIEHKLGMEPGALSRPLGYLPVEPVSRSVTVEGAIAQNVVLTDDEKAALSSMYRVLVKRSTRGLSPERPRSQPMVSPNRARANPTPAAPTRPRTVPGGR